MSSARRAPDGADGWYRGGVTLTWDVVDAESPSSLAKIGCVDQTVAADQPETLYSCSATSAGGSSGPVTVSIKRDGTAPTVLCGAADGLWHTDDVVITCTAFDALSLLLDAADASFVLTTSVADGTETAVRPPTAGPSPTTPATSSTSARSAAQDRQEGSGRRCDAADGAGTVERGFPALPDGARVLRTPRMRRSRS